VQDEVKVVEIAVDCVLHVGLLTEELSIQPIN
jgi:hypothetical protein